MKVIKNSMPIRERVALKQAQEQETKNKANIDYIAMMSDIDIPTEEDIEDGTQSEI